MSTKRLPSLFRKKSERLPADSYGLPRSHSRAIPDEPPQSSLEPAPASTTVDDHAEPLPRESAYEATQPVDMTTELTNQLQSAMWRCNNLEARLDRALRETAMAKEHRDELMTSLAQAEAKAEKSARELQWNGAELDRMKRELGEEREKREFAERELEHLRQQAELLEWKLQEQEEHAVGLRSLAAQAEGSMELARAEITAVEAKCKEEIARVKDEADAEVAKMKLLRNEAQERVGWLEEELLAVKGRVSLSEFRLGEELSRSEALIAEADELTEKLREAEDLLEVCYEKYGVPRKVKQKAPVSSPELTHHLDKQCSAGSSNTSSEQPSREQQLLQQQRPSVATDPCLGGPEGKGRSFSGKTGEYSGSEQQSSNGDSDLAERLSSDSSSCLVHTGEEVESRTGEESTLTSVRFAPSASHNDSEEPPDEAHSS